MSSVESSKKTGAWAGRLSFMYAKLLLRVRELMPDLKVANSYDYFEFEF